MQPPIATYSIATYVGIGANLGDPVQTIIDARKLLAELSYCDELTSSSLYWSSPVGYEGQPAFINCAVRLLVDVEPTKLFEDMQHIELSLGRTRCEANQNAPRHIDLDMLLFGDLLIESDCLQVPHPRMLSRRFVIEPLLELEPNLRIDGELLASHYAIKEAKNQFLNQEIHRLGM